MRSIKKARARQFRAVRRNCRASPIKEKRQSRFSTLDFLQDCEQWSFALHPCTAYYRIFAWQKYAVVLPRYDTASVPCIARSEAFCTAIAERLLSQSAHKCRAVCPHKELQSAFIPFITSERMRYESLRADKRKTAKPFFNSRLLIRFRAVVVRGTSVHRLLPYFCIAKIRSRFAKIRHGLHAV